MTINDLINLDGVVKDEYYVNIVAKRTSRVYTNKFTDIIYWFYLKNNEWVLKSARCTTKSGLYYVDNFLNPKGTGIIKPGFYKDSHMIGYHKGQYKALVQKSPITVFRDKDKDDWVDYVQEETGLFGINIHRANSQRESIQVDKWSAACIVFSDPFKFNDFMTDCELHSTMHTNNFNLILI